MSLAKPIGRDTHGDAASMISGFEHRNIYKVAIDEANSFKCTECKHRGPIEAYPEFHKKADTEWARFYVDVDKSQQPAPFEDFTMIKDPKTVLGEEFLCYHTRNVLPETSLGIGVSISRLPRTGEIRSVTPTLDLLCLRAFSKMKIRKSISNQRFTHWLPLYFGEEVPFKTKTQVFNEETKEFVWEENTIKPKERLVKLLSHAICFLTKGSTKKEMTPEMIIEVMPKLIITHIVELIDEKNHVSITAIRRLINFIRLFRLLIELQPSVQATVNERLNTFISKPETRIKDHTASLGDILSYSAVTDSFSFKDLLTGYLEEQLDRQAFWILRKIPELDHTDEKFKGKETILEDSRAEVCYKTGIAGF
jgi:hypothetical protein